MAKHVSTPSEIALRVTRSSSTSRANGETDIVQEEAVDPTFITFPW